VVVAGVASSRHFRVVRGLPDRSDAATRGGVAIAGSAATGAVTGDTEGADSGDATEASAGAVLAAVLAGVQGVATGGAAGLAGEAAIARAAGGAAVAGVVTALLTPATAALRAVTPSPVTPSFVVPSFVVPGFVVPGFVVPGFIGPGFIMLGNACRRCSAKFEALLEVLAPATADGAALVPLPGVVPFAVVADAAIRVALAGPLAPAREAAKDESDTPGGLAKVGVARVGVARVARAAPGMEQILPGPPGRRGLSEHQEPGMSKAWANGE